MVKLFPHGYPKPAMNPNYKQALRNSLSHRKQLSIPRIRWLVVIIVVSLILYLVLSVIIAPENEPEYHFIHEQGTVTALSAIFLSMAGGFAGVSFFLLRTKDGWLSYFWLLAALSFGFLSLDELLSFHELAGYWISAIIGDPQSFRNWNDVIVIFYGLFAVFLMFFFLPEIIRYPKLAELMAVAFLFFCIHTLMDSTTVSKTAVTGIVEEAAKVFCSAFSSIAMFTALLGIICSKVCNISGDLHPEN